MMQRTDNAGTWTSDDNGTTWLLTTPSAEWLAERAIEPEPDPKQTKRDQLIAWHHAELDTLLGDGAGSIAEMTAEINTLAAVQNRTAAQNAQLANLRDARADARRWVRTAKLALILDGAVRDVDLGSDG